MAGRRCRHVNTGRFTNYQVFPVATDLQPAPQSLLHLIRCNYSSECSSMRCNCRKNSLQFFPAFSPAFYPAFFPNQGKHTATIFKEQESDKERKYNRRDKDIDMEFFTPRAFGTNGGMGLACQNFLRTLANKLSSKSKEPYASVISWLGIQLSFAVLRTVQRCVKGSRYPYKSREVSKDFTLAVPGLHFYS